MQKHFCLFAALVLTTPLLSHAADAAAGKAKAEAVCAACHGANGISVSDAIPNLAGQRTAYLEGQLKAFKSGARKAPSATSPVATMVAIATQLSDDDIANVAAHFATQAGASGDTKSAQLANVAKTSVTFPEGYQSSFTKYHTISFPATKQVRYYFANPVAVKAAKEGKDLPNGSYLFAEVYSAKLGADGAPVKGADGQFVADKLVAYTAMGRDAGWGKDIPDMLRNEEWNYAVFAADKQRRTAANQAECLGCHKPLDKTSYTFTIKELATVAKR
jgi:cytochrome c553